MSPVTLQPSYVFERQLGLPAHCSAHWMVVEVEQAAAVLLDLRLWLKRCMPGYLKDTRRSETRGRHIVSSHLSPGISLFFLCWITWSAGVSYLPDVSLGVLAMERSAGICAVLSPRFSANKAVLTWPSPPNSRGAFLLYFQVFLPRGSMSPYVLQNVEKTPPWVASPRPRLLERNNGGRNFFPVAEYILAVTSRARRAQRGRWEMECSRGSFVHLCG